jgi:hypothetical protein
MEKKRQRCIHKRLLALMSLQTAAEQLRKNTGKRTSTKMNRQKEFQAK